MLILVRHGQTAANAEGRLLGRLDPPLTALGRRQAMALAASVGQPVRVVASPLRRAQETAALLGLPAHVPVSVDERWVEIDYGIYDGRPLRDVPPDLWAEWRTDSGFRPPGGESLRDLGQRVREACEELAGQAAGADIVVVSHVSPIKAAVAWALGAGDEVAWRTRLDVAAVCRIAIGQHGPSLWAFNDISHLGLVIGSDPSPAAAGGDKATPADRAAVLAGAARRRADWEGGVAAVASGALDLDGARADPALAGIKAVKVIEVLPGSGKVKGRRAMAEAGIGERERLGEIDEARMSALRAALGL